MNTTVEDHGVGFFTADLFVYIVTKWPHLIACEHIFLQHLGKDLSYYGQMQPFIWLGKPPPDMTSPPRAVFFFACVCSTGAWRKIHSSELQPLLPSTEAGLFQSAANPDLGQFIFCARTPLALTRLLAPARTRCGWTIRIRPAGRWPERWWPEQEAPSPAGSTAGSDARCARRSSPALARSSPPVDRRAKLHLFSPPNTHAHTHTHKVRHLLNAEMSINELPKASKLRLQNSKSMIQSFFS